MESGISLSLTDIWLWVNTIVVIGLIQMDPGMKSISLAGNVIPAAGGSRISQAGGLHQAGSR